MSVQHFGPYRLLGLLGRGAMGEVHKAFDTRRNRLVALKTLSPRLRDDPTFEVRFQREAGAAARLRDPHVVPIHDFGVIEDRPYIDMRLIEGTDLRTLLRRRGPLHPAHAASVVAQVAGALDAAHAEGLVHRDVKPSNVLLAEPNGFAYLIDFGLARHVGATRLTESGVAVGTLAYMAPELFDGVGDHRVDVYALSCLLFEALTGRTPFLAHDLPTMMHAHLTLPVPRATRLRPGLPASVDGVVARGMDKDPERRYARAGELAAAARSALRDAPPRPPARERSTGVPPGGRVRRRLAYATVAVLGVLAVGLVGISVLDERLTVTIRPPGVGAATVGPAQVVDEVDVGESPRNLALSADGRRLYATNRGDDSVSVIDAASGTVVRTVELDAGSGPEGIATVPGTDLAYVVNNGSDTVTVLDSTSGLVQQTILVGGFPTDVAVSPDGATAYVAANAGGQVLAVDAIAVRQTLVTGVAPQSLTVSANGRTAFVTDAGQDVLLVVDTASGTVTGRVPVGRVPDGVALSPDERTAYVANIDDDSLSVVDLATLTVRTSIAVGARPIAVAVHPDGRSAFVTSNESDTLSVIDTGTDRVRQALPVGSLPEAVVVSADGSRVYVVNAGDGTVSIVDPAPG